MYGFIKGRVSTADQLSLPREASWIAKKLAKWHKVRLPQGQDDKGEPKQMLWHTLRRWILEGMSLSTQLYPSLFSHHHHP